MKLTFLGHAGWYVDTPAGGVLCDPWDGRNTKFFGSWSVWPPNDHVDWAEYLSPRFLYVSHAHEDHFDPGVLSRVDKNAVVLLPPDRHGTLWAKLRALGFRRFVHRPVGFAGLRAEVIPFDDPTGETEDSALVLSAGGKTFFNLNDSRLTAGQARAVLDAYGSVDLFTGQFSCAAWYPMCYPCPDGVMRRRCEANVGRTVTRFWQAADMLRAAKAVPASGPPLLLGAAADLNMPKGWGRPNAFPDAWQVEWDRKVYRPPIGVAFDISNPPDSNEFVTTKAAVAARFGPTNPPPYPPTASVDEAVAGFLKVVTPAAEAFRQWLPGKVPETVVLWVVGGPKFFISLSGDGPAVSVNIVRQPAAPYHQTVMPADVFVAAANLGLDDWEPYFISMRCRLYRDPDAYNPWLWVFWRNLDPARIRDIAERSRGWPEPAPDRVSVGGYSAPRACPHQGVDLGRYGVVDEANGVFRCEAHGLCWRLADGSPVGHKCGPLDVRKGG